MKFGLWLLVKLAAIGVVVAACWAVVLRLLPPHPGGLLSSWPRLGIDFPYTIAVFLLGLFAAALLGICFWDQRYRCRVCGRRLRMPRTEGIYSSIVLGGLPHTEYICTYGHGNLYVPDVHTSYRPAKWTRYDSLWDDLLQAEHSSPPRRP